MFEAAIAPLAIVFLGMVIIGAMAYVWGEKAQLARVAKHLGIPHAIVVQLANQNETGKLLEMAQERARSRCYQLYGRILNLLDELETRASSDDEKGKFWEDLYTQMNSVPRIAPSSDLCRMFSDILTKISTDALNPDTCEEYLELEIEVNQLRISFNRLERLALKIKVSEPEAA
jgi:hypothetical protein